ncbi:MFS transporter [Actinoplanes sp. DH11]|uniref:MFS transporter n=1 Tax=Actinoplanes sp. DH11 TaxID=2857011 RepID=UPI001E3F45E2|nr:MFS transporter [Actinoplanes sp. DH11]
MVTDGLRRARVAVGLAFAANGVLFGTWTPRIPAVQEALGLGDGELGLALLAPALGSVGSMLVTGFLVQRFGAGRVLRCALTGFAVTLPMIGFASSLPWLFLTMLVWGAAMGALDVSMNSAGLGVQQGYGRPVLSGFHGVFSAGGLAGAVLGSVAAGFGLPVATHLLAAGGLGLLVAVVVSRIPVPDPDGPARAAPPESGPVSAGGTGGEPVSAGGADEGVVRGLGRLIRTPALAVLGGLAFAGLLAEGAVADWSAVYLSGSLGASPGLAGAGFVAFSVTMTVGRMVGDRVVAAVGPVRTVRLAATVATAALAAALLIDSGWAAVAGFAVLGAGLATLVPVVFTAAAQRSHSPATAVAAVSTCGYLGFIAGPSLIGGIASVIGLGGALWLVVALTGVVAVLAPVTAPARGPEAISRLGEVRGPGADGDTDGSPAATIFPRHDPSG